MNPSYFLVFVPLREPDGQASGGKDFGSDDWIFTIRERDPKKLQNGASPTGEEEVVTELKATSDCCAA